MSTKTRIISRRSPAEAGQSILLIALMMVGVLAITGLAIDGGGLYFLHRDTQNAADAAVLAAAYAKCVNDDTAAIQEAAYAAAARNGFDNDGTTNWVSVNIPPTRGDVAIQTTDYVEIIIKAEKPNYFIRIVYSEPLYVESRAVATCSPEDAASAYNTALFSAGQCAPKGVDVTGSGITIEGGVASNGNTQILGGTGSVTIWGDPEATSYGGYVNPDKITPGDGTLDTEIPSDPLPAPILFEVDDYVPGTARATEAQIDGRYFYDNGTDRISQHISNGDIHVTGSTIRIDEAYGLIVVEGSDVWIEGFVPGAALTVVSDGDIKLTMGSTGLAYTGYVDNIVAFSEAGAPGDCNTSDGIDMSGNYNTVHGLLYAPYGRVSLSASDNTVIGAVIGYTINFSGSNNTIIYDPDMLPPTPPYINLVD